jgi:hypothetical protein
MQPTKPFHLASESTRKWWACPGLLYFLGVGEPVVAVKIGMLAVTPKLDTRMAMTRRLAAIQSCNHELVRVLGVVVRNDGPHPTKDTEDHERALHLEFQQCSLFSANTRGAEWFRATPEVLARIKASSRLPAEAGIPESVATLALRGQEMTPNKSRERTREG